MMRSTHLPKNAFCRFRYCWVMYYRHLARKNNKNMERMCKCNQQTKPQKPNLYRKR